MRTVIFWPTDGLVWLFPATMNAGQSSYIRNAVRHGVVIMPVAAVVSESEFQYP